MSSQSIERKSESPQAVHLIAPKGSVGLPLWFESVIALGQGSLQGATTHAVVSHTISRLHSHNLTILSC